MPRAVFKPKDALETLSVLDADCSLDRDNEPELEDETLLAMHRDMLLSRRFDERLLTLQRQGNIGTFAPVQGQEAAQIGAVAALTGDDWMVPAFRETAASISRGTPLEGILLFNAGYNEGGRVPDGQNDLPIAIPVANQLPHAVGIAYAMKYRSSGTAALTFFGDGATSEGDFHEAMNFASVFELPVVFVCQNNQWAISVPRSRQTASETLSQKALAYAMPGVQVDGNDILAVYAVTRDAVDRARAGGGPTLIECVTYRLSLHTTADDPTKYRDEEEVARWRERDPIPRFQSYLKDKQLLIDGDIANLESEIEKEIDLAWETAQETIASLDGPLAMFEHAYAEPPGHLLEQRAELERALAARTGDRGDG